MPAPIKLADFRTDSHSLSSRAYLPLRFFILMRCHNLDYPDFYNSLYRTLQPSIFYAKHRARYFRLLTLCLTSSTLPAHVTTAFLKK